jgi:hypothetical protein
MPCAKSVAGGDDDEAGHEVGEERAGHRVALLAPELLGRYPAFDDRRLEIELHVGRDRRPGRGDQEQQVAAVGVDLRRHDRVGDAPPVRMGEHGRDGIGE